MKKKCPLLNKPCIEDKCAWWVEMVAKNKATGELQPYHDCAITKLTVLGLELLQKTTGVQKATESFRNETVKRQDAFLGMIPRKRIANAD